MRLCRQHQPVLLQTEILLQAAVERLHGLRHRVGTQQSDIQRQQALHGGMIGFGGRHHLRHLRCHFIGFDLRRRQLSLRKRAHFVVTQAHAQGFGMFGQKIRIFR